MLLKQFTIYNVMSGWKLWETETSNLIAAQADGADFEIFYPVMNSATFLTTAATALISYLVF